MLFNNRLSKLNINVNCRITTRKGSIGLKSIIEIKCKIIIESIQKRRPHKRGKV